MLVIDHDPINIPAGTRNWGPVALPDGYSTLSMRLARQTTADPNYFVEGVAVSLKIKISLDGGVTWPVGRGFTAEGGPIVSVIDDVPREAVESSVSFPLPAGTSRLIKLTLVVTGGRLRSLLTVEVI